MDALEFGRCLQVKSERASELRDSASEVLTFAINRPHCSLRLSAMQLARLATFRLLVDSFRGHFCGKVE